MGYLHINNLYKDTDILLFKECYALEKIHGSSAHINFKNTKLTFFAGGESHERFLGLFNQEFLSSEFTKIGQDDVTVYGEVYGGKCQGMSETYGKELKFVAFDVKIGDSWLSVPQAHEFVSFLGLEFVDYVKIPTTLEAIDKERDKDSVQAVRNGCGTGKIREGVILRGIIELTKNNGARIIAKHKRDEFRETKTPRPVVDPAKLQVLENAELIAQEWVVGERLNHVLSKIPNVGIENTGEVIKAMIDDVKREGEKEIVWSKDVEKAIGKATALLFKNKLKESLKNL